MVVGELSLSRVDVAIVERRPNQELAGSRAGGLHARTIEVLDQRGIADRFLSQGKVMQVAGSAMSPLDISDFPTRHNSRRHVALQVHRYGPAGGVLPITAELPAEKEDLPDPPARTMKSGQRRLGADDAVPEIGEEVSVAEELLCAALVEDDARVER